MNRATYSQLAEWSKKVRLLFVPTWLLFVPAHAPPCYRPEMAFGGMCWAAFALYVIGFVS